MSAADLRAAFEAWLPTQYGERFRNSLRAMDPAVAAWEAWQAAYKAGMIGAAEKVEEIEARCVAADVDDPPLAEVAEAIRKEADEQG